jgi:hypothetical protein
MGQQQPLFLNKSGKLKETLKVDDGRQLRHDSPTP